MDTAMRTCVLLAAGLLCAMPATAWADFVPAYTAGNRDAGGRFMGGTELRVLTSHAGKLYAGLGYWQDRPGPEGPQSAAVLVLDNPHAAWRIDDQFPDRMPNGRSRDFAVSVLQEARFATDGAGAKLPQPVTILLASSWDRTGAVRVFSRDDASGTWTPATLAQDRPSPTFLPQLRSLATHRDARTGVDRVFAGTDPRGIYSGVYNPATPGRIAWDPSPELDIRATRADAFPGLHGRLRISSFAEANGTLFAAVGQSVFERIDGPTPTWHQVYANPRPAYSQTGLRGLTAIANPSGPGEVLLAAVEGNNARIVRIDPRDGSETTDLDLVGLLDRAWQTRVSYAIAGYNDMTRIPDTNGGQALVIGLEAFIPPAAPRPPGHVVLDVVHGLEAGGWYVVRHADGSYDLHQITTPLPGIGTALVAVRTSVLSPFPGDAGTLYLGGYDANGTAAHNTAWVVRAEIDTVLHAGAAR